MTFCPPATVLYAFSQSDGFARAIVLLLCLLSIYAWSIMAEKGLVIRRGRRASRRFLRAFSMSSGPLDLALQTDDYSSPVARVYECGVDEVMDVLHVDPQLIDTYCRRRSLPRPLTSFEVDKIRSTMERTVAAQIMKLESRLGMLGTTVTVSPFLGLLGTVWGVMMAFCGMAQKGRPDIGVIAPGVSGALLTTVVGLIVAIPAVVGYNLLANSVRQTTVEMDNFLEDFIALLKLQTDTPTSPPGDEEPV
jgi:biopolymer transport protein TolQ